MKHDYICVLKARIDATENFCEGQQVSPRDISAEGEKAIALWADKYLESGTKTCECKVPPLVTEVYTGLPVSVILDAKGTLSVSVDLSEAADVDSDSEDNQGDLLALQSALDKLHSNWLTATSKEGAPWVTP